VSGDAVASAADRRRQRQLSVDPSVILSSRPSVQPLRHRTQAAKQLAVTTEFEHVQQTLQQHGFEVIDEPTESFDGVGKQSNYVTRIEASGLTCSNGKSSERCGSRHECVTEQMNSGPVST